jgi:hypothetical protein
VPLFGRAIASNPPIRRLEQVPLERRCGEQAADAAIRRRRARPSARPHAGARAFDGHAPHPAGADAPRLAQGAPAHDIASPVWETVPDARGSAGGGGARERDRVLRRSLALSDVAATVLSVLFVLNPVVWGPGMGLRVTDVLLVPFVILAAKAIGLYDRDQDVLRKTTLDEVPSIIYFSILYALTVWLAEDALFHGWLTRPQVFALALATFTLTTMGRALTRTVVTNVTPHERCLIVGEPADTERIVAKLETSPGVNAVVVGSAALQFSERATRQHTGSGARGADDRVPPGDDRADGDPAHCPLNGNL